MNLQEFKTLVEPFTKACENLANIDSAIMYAFRSSKVKVPSNPHITLNYEIFKTTIPKNDMVKSVSNILSYLINTKFSRSKSLSFENYNIQNSKTVIDFMKLNKYDFSKPNILNGTETNIDPNTYKIEFFMNCLKTDTEIAANEKDYDSFRYTAIKLKTVDGKFITILNKGTPVYKAKNALFTFEVEEGENPSVSFKPVKTKLFKIPLYPNMIIFDDYCFMITNNIEGIFGFEEYNKKVCTDTMSVIKSGVKLKDNSFDLINTFVSKGKNYNLFADFNDDVLKGIKSKDPDKMKFLKDELKISLTPQDEILLQDEKEVERFIGFICHAIKLDPLTGGYVYAHKSTPVKY